MQAFGRPINNKKLDQVITQTKGRDN